MDEADIAVEWHLAGDLKSLKCMFGCKQGANAEYTCIYCTFKKNSQGSIQKGAPNRDKKDPNWSPILPIFLERVHFCTLHSEIRMLDKLLHLHVTFAWNMKPKKKSDECLAKLEEILSKMGLHGGNVKLCRDGNNDQNVPAKVSMGGGKARRLLSNHSKSSKLSYENWKDICACTTNQVDSVVIANKRMKVWVTLDRMVKTMKKRTIQQSELQEFGKTIDEFIAAMVDAWGATHLTHYMVIYCFDVFY